MRWVLKLTQTIEQRWRTYARPVGKSWRVDETYINAAQPLTRAPGDIHDLWMAALLAQPKA